MKTANSKYFHRHGSSRPQTAIIEQIACYCCLGFVIYLLWCFYYLSQNGDGGRASLDLTWEKPNANVIQVPLLPESFDILENTTIVYAAIPTNNAVKTYPHYDSLLDVLQNWNPNQPNPPKYFKETIMHFNFSNIEERQLAEQYREAEIPFKLYDIPELNVAQKKWTDAYLLQALQYSREDVEMSKSNHFMYWNRNGFKQNGQHKPPTSLVTLSFAEWLQFARRGDALQIGNESTHYYFMTSTDPGDKGRSFISRDLRSFSSQKENFFIRNVHANKGIQCRFAMRGIISESHYDSGRNFVFMLKGNKRYVLTGPNSCKQLGIITDPLHPSYRHSVIDWSDLNQARSRGFDKIAAIDTIVRAGEALYIPSYWFHYIVALQYSIQCNSRSGSPPHEEGLQEIEECMGKRRSHLRTHG